MEIIFTWHAITDSVAETLLSHWDAAVMLMDDELRERVHTELAPCTNEAFLERYCELHVEKYGIPFVI